MRLPCPERDGLSTARWSALRHLLGGSWNAPSRTEEAEAVLPREVEPQWSASVGSGLLLLPT